MAGIAGVLRPGGRLVAEMGGGANVARTTQAIRAGRAAVGLDPDVAVELDLPDPGPDGVEARARTASTSRSCSASTG